MSTNQTKMLNVNPIPAAIFWSRKHWRSMGGVYELVPLNHVFEDAIKVGGNETSGALSGAGQLQQGGVGIRSPFYTQLGTEPLS